MKSVLENNPSKTIEPSGFSTARGRNSLRAWKPLEARIVPQKSTRHCVLHGEPGRDADGRSEKVLNSSAQNNDPKSWRIEEREIYMYIERFNKPVKCYR